MVDPSGKSRPGWKSEPSVTPGQLSSAAGGVQVTTVLAVMAPGPVPAVRSVGMPTMTGLSTSLTLTVWVALALLPAASVAVQVIVVEPVGKASPSAPPSLRTPTSLTPGALSLAVVPRLATRAPHWPPSVGAVTFAPRAMTGFVSSTTVTGNDWLTVWPAASVAV